MRTIEKVDVRSLNIVLTARGGVRYAQSILQGSVTLILLYVSTSSLVGGEVLIKRPR